MNWLARRREHESVGATTACLRPSGRAPTKGMSVLTCRSPSARTKRSIPTLVPPVTAGLSARVARPRWAKRMKVIRRAEVFLLFWQGRVMWVLLDFGTRERKPCSSSFTRAAFTSSISPVRGSWQHRRQLDMWCSTVLPFGAPQLGAVPSGMSVPCHLHTTPWTVTRTGNCRRVDVE